LKWSSIIPRKLSDPGERLFSLELPRKYPSAVFFFAGNKRIARETFDF